MVCSAVATAFRPGDVHTVTSCARAASRLKSAANLHLLGSPANSRHRSHNNTIPAPPPRQRFANRSACHHERNQRPSAFRAQYPILRRGSDLVSAALPRMQETR